MNVFCGDLEVLGGISNFVVVFVVIKSVMEDISEDILEFVVLDDDEDLNDVFVYDEGDEIFINSGG